jgi:two-component system, NtrC family, sensor histidine kinase HydH
LKLQNNSRALRTTVVIVAVCCGILALSIASVRRERERLVEEFGETTRRQLQASVEALSVRLQALDQDTRLLADVVEHESMAEARIDAATERRVWESAFHALAVVVPQYRVVALVDATGAIEVMGLDRSEKSGTIEALMPPTRRLGQEVSARGVKALGKTERFGERSFFLYGAPIRGRRAIVVASDAAIFLGAVAWTPLPSARLFVTDPAGVTWGGCETALGCHATEAKLVPDEPALPRLPNSAPAGRVVRLARIPALALSEAIERPTGTWVVKWLASTEAIIDREQAMISRVVLTALAVAVAFAAVGAFVLRQQRQAVELAGRLRYAQELATARATSQSIVENAPLGVLGLSQDGRVVLANNFLVERLGPVRVGVPLGEAFSEAGTPWAKELESLLLDASTQEIRSVATGTHQFLVRIVPVRGGNELGVRTFALVEDQSELRTLENHLVRAEKLITVGVLSAGIAHEIGSPLAVIRGRAEQTLRTLGDDRGDSRRAEDLRVIIKHIDHISSTIRQILDFSRRQSIERHPVSLDEAFEQVRLLLQWNAASRRVKLHFEVDRVVEPVSADADQLQQVLVNLILNACDASPEGGEVRIVATAARPGYVRLAVIDAGCGIASEHLHAVFDPFFTTKKRGEGTGLGLPIAASIVRNHGGDINLQSAPGRGTEVTISWPTMPRMMTAVPAAEPAWRKSHA